MLQKETNEEACSLDKMWLMRKHAQCVLTNYSFFIAHKDIHLHLNAKKLGGTLKEGSGGSPCLICWQGTFSHKTIFQPSSTTHNVELIDVHGIIFCSWFDPSCGLKELANILWIIILTIKTWHLKVFTIKMNRVQWYS